LDEAKKIALESFTGFNADLAKILDMDNKRKLVGVVKR
jgi:hypothetical protein